MSKITIPVEDADLAEAFLRLLPADWTIRSGTLAPIQAVLSIVAEQNSNGQTDIRVEDMSAGHPYRTLFKFSAPNQLYVDLASKVKP